MVVFVKLCRAKALLLHFGVDKPDRLQATSVRRLFIDPLRADPPRCGVEKWSTVHHTHPPNHNGNERFKAVWSKLACQLRLSTQNAWTFNIEGGAKFTSTELRMDVDAAHSPPRLLQLAKGLNYLRARTQAIFNAVRVAPLERELLLSPVSWRSSKGCHPQRTIVGIVNKLMTPVCTRYLAWCLLTAAGFAGVAAIHQPGCDPMLLLCHCRCRPGITFVRASVLQECAEYEALTSPVPGSVKSPVVHNA